VACAGSDQVAGDFPHLPDVRRYSVIDFEVPGLFADMSDRVAAAPTIRGRSN
jgi:hypothetical protein